MFIRIYNLHTKTSLSQDNILLLVVTFITISILKSYIFTFCDNIIDLSYIPLFLCSTLIFFNDNSYLNLFSDSGMTDTDAPHDRVSESDSSQGGRDGGRGPNPPNPDVIMADIPEDRSDSPSGDSNASDAPSGDSDASESSGDSNASYAEDLSSDESDPSAIELTNDETKVRYKGQNTPLVIHGEKLFFIVQESLIVYLWIK